MNQFTMIKRSVILVLFTMALASHELCAELQWSDRQIEFRPTVHDEVIRATLGFEMVEEGPTHKRAILILSFGMSGLTYPL